MVMMRPAVLLMTVLALGACVASEPSAPLSGPQGLMARIYDGRSVQIDAFADPAQRASFFTPSLSQQIAAAETCAITQSAASLDFNPLLPTQDYRRASYRVDTLAQTSSAAQIAVSVLQREVVQEVITFTLLSSGAAWRIDEVANGGIALSTRLAAACAEPVVETPELATLAPEDADPQ